MQNFAINEGSLNGDPQVWIDDSSVSLSVQADGDMMLGLSLAGSAPVALDASLPLAFMAKLSGAAGVAIVSDGDIAYGVSLVGSAAVTLSASGSVLRWVLVEGQTPVALDLSGYIVAVPPISATFTAVIGADLDLAVAVGRSIEGLTPVVVSSTFKAYSVPATAITGAAIVQVAGIGCGSLSISSPEAQAVVVIGVDGDSRLGEKVQIEGDAVIETYARGYLESWHYIYA